MAWSAYCLDEKQKFAILRFLKIDASLQFVI